jgi:hypothetical protein
MRQLYKLFHFGHLLYLNPRPGMTTMPPRPRRRSGGRWTRCSTLAPRRSWSSGAGQELGPNQLPPEGLMIVSCPTLQPHLLVVSLVPGAHRAGEGQRCPAVRDSMAVQLDKLIRLCSDL